MGEKRFKININGSSGWLVQDTLTEAWKSIAEQAETILKLNVLASDYPYYKYNGLWTRDIQNTVRIPGGDDESSFIFSNTCFGWKWDSYQIFAIVLSGWLGGFSSDLIDDLPQTGRLLTIDEVGEILDGIIWWANSLFPFLHEIFENMKLNRFLKTKQKTVPINLKETDAFHITIEEYLQALITLVEELVRPYPSPPLFQPEILELLFFYTYVLVLRKLLPPVCVFRQDWPSTPSHSVTTTAPSRYPDSSKISTPASRLST